MAVNKEWSLVFHEEPVDLILQCRAREKRDLTRTFEELLNDPSLAPDFEERDSSGRPLRVIVRGHWAVTYWVDNYVKEIRIVDIDKADA
jgi:hypothetical protein